MNLDASVRCVDNLTPSSIATTFYIHTRAVLRQRLQKLCISVFSKSNIELTFATLFYVPAAFFISSSLSTSFYFFSFEVGAVSSIWSSQRRMQRLSQVHG